MEGNIPKQHLYNIKDFFTPIEEAIYEAKKRREGSELVEHVNRFLNNDIPVHFNREVPVLYLSRHIATPNYEALRFVEIGKPHGLPLVIGQDKKGKFVSHNELKRALGKLPVTKGISKHLDDITENFTVIDFMHAQGKPFEEITTKHGKNIVEFHNSFFKYIYPNEVEIIEESDWIDRNSRDELYEQYRKMLALTITHAVMFESFPETERDIVENVFGPAFDSVFKEFGVKPLVVEHIDEELEMTKDWNGYPSVLYQFIKNDIEGNNICE
jgi:hypothetical protein